MARNWFNALWRRRLPDKLSYEQARDVLQEHSQAMREDLARREDVPPEMLYYLAGDREPSVRQLVAANPAAPIHADEILADDPNGEVRGELARKIARLVPGLSAAQHAELSKRALVIFEQLAQDQLPLVRKIVAEEIKNADGVPRHIIQKLARDAELVVCGPILEYSPLLADEDLIEIIATSHVDGALSAIARRRQVSEPVADEIVASLDIPAVAALLANPNAQIRQDTLDDIVAQAENIEPWHRPIVLRPDLSLRAIRRIAGFVAQSLLQELGARHDLDRETRTLLRERIGKRIKTEKTPSDQDEMARQLATIHTAFQEGRLDDETISDAAQSGRRAQVVLALALLAGLPEEPIEKIFQAKSGKGITALCWKAGLSMRTAHTIQTAVARLPPDLIILPRNGFDYPMDETELAWHLNFFGIKPD